jgi:hypothetical protein
MLYFEEELSLSTKNLPSNFYSFFLENTNLQQKKKALPVRVTGRGLMVLSYGTERWELYVK